MTHNNHPANITAPRRLLGRIADALEITLTDLLQMDEAATTKVSARVETLSETMELIRLFARIEQPQTRRRCLAIVRAAVQEAEGKSATSAIEKQ